MRAGRTRDSFQCSRLLALAGLAVAPIAAWRAAAAPEVGSTLLRASRDGVVIEQSIGPRGEGREVTVSAKSFTALGGRQAGAAWFFDARRFSPPEVPGFTCRTEVAAPGRTISLESAPDGRTVAICGEVAALLPTSTALLVIAPREADVALAREIVLWVDALALAGDAVAPGFGRIDATCLVALEGVDDRNSREGGPHRFSNLIVGHAGALEWELGVQIVGRFVLERLLASGARGDDPYALACAAAAADLLQQSLRGGGSRFDGALARERRRERAAQTSDPARYLRREPIVDPDRQEWAIDCLAPGTRAALLERCARGGVLDRESADALLRLLQAGVDDQELRSWCDPVESRQAALAELRRLPPVDPLLPAPANPTLHLEVASDHNGYLESCGCKSTQGGGFIDLWNWWRPRAGVGAARLLLGGVLGAPGSAGYSREANALLLDSARTLGVDAWVPGPRELALLASGDLAAAAIAGLPFVACNVRPRAGREAELPSFARFVDLDRAGAPARLIGVARLSSRYSAPSREALVESRFEMLEPIAALLEEIDRAPLDRALVIAGGIEPTTARAVAAASPRPLLFLSTDALYAWLDGEVVQENQRDGSVAGDPIAFAPTGPYWVGRVDWQPGAGIRSAATKLAELPAEERVREEFRERVQALLEREAGPVELQYDDPLLRDGNRYVGGSTCAGCHPAEHSDWLETPHARAWKTLERVQRQRVRNCVACHVVGFGQESGYAFEAPEEELRNVGCEVCHGPGGFHVDRGGHIDAIRRSPPLSLCASCHTTSHSDLLLGNPSSFRDRIDHDPATGSE